jgi:hypothetical protein
MTTEIATVERTDIEVLPPARPPAAQAIGQLMAHAEAMSAAKQLADALCASELVPAIYRDKPGNGAAAILYGAELGLNPIQSLQQIFVVHGQPAIYARTAVALLKRAGFLIETVSSADEAVTVRGTDPRSGQVEESTWTIARAKKAGYTSNKKYDTDPQAMLYAKAAMEVARKIAPDVLLGIGHSREELELDEQPRRVHSERARGVDALAQRVAQQTNHVVQEETGSGAGDTSQADTPVENTAASPGTGKTPYDPNQVSPADHPQRRKYLNQMFALFAKADVAKDNREDRLIVTRALVGRAEGGAPIDSSGDLTDRELRALVETLQSADKAKTLGDKVAEILNTHALNQAETTIAATEQEQSA